MEKDLSKEWLFTRPKGVSYTAMCIWVDENISKPDCDDEKAYKYIWLIANMLACKAKYFGSRWLDYNDFSSYLANDVYFRLKDTKKKKIKSVLNYMKSILYFRKCAYCDETYSEVIDVKKSQYDKFNEDLFKDRYKNSLESYNHVMLEMQIEDIMEDLPNIIKSNISSVYKSDKKLYENIYISSLFTMINRITLPNSKLEFLTSKYRIHSKFDDIQYYVKNRDNNIISWHIPEEIQNIVSVIVSRSYNTIIDNIKEAMDSNKMEDDEYASILASGFFGDGSDD